MNTRKRHTQGLRKLGADFKGIFSRRDGNNCKRRHTEPIERQRTEIPPRQGRTNTGGQPTQECTERGQPAGISQNPRSDSGQNHHPPGRAVTFNLSAEPEELNPEAQHQPSDPSDKHSPRKPRSSPTWSSRISNSGASIRSVATATIKNLLCIEPSALRPKLLRSKSDQSWRRKSRDINGPDAEPDEKTKPRKVNTFPREKMAEPKSPDFEALRAFLRQREQTYEDFSTIWEEKALPTLRSAMVKNSVGDYSITVQFDYGYTQRIVEVMTQTALPQDVGKDVKVEVSALFVDFASPVDIQFTVGEVKRTSSAPPEEGPWDDPGNPSSHEFPLFQGDSVGCQDLEFAATIGPAIKGGRRTGCLVSYHLFDGHEELKELRAQRQPPPLRLVHPAKADCPRGKEPRDIAVLHAASGDMCSTQRPSRSLREFVPMIPTSAARVVTDWAICVPESGDLQLENRLRYAPEGREFQGFSGPIPGVFRRPPRFTIVRSSGRSSGIRWATVCEVPGEVKHGSGDPTREWYLEHIPPGFPGGMEPEAWNSGGAGVPGDSGAAVIDDESRQFIGQIWGRNVYGGNTATPRITYFTHVYDLFDDIRDHCPEFGYPTLLGQTDEPDLGPTEPVTVTPQNVNKGPSSYRDTDGTTLGSQRSAWRPTSSPSDEKGETKSISQGSTCCSMSDSSALHEPVSTTIIVLGKDIEGVNAIKEPPHRMVMGS